MLYRTTSVFAGLILALSLTAARADEPKFQMDFSLTYDQGVYAVETFTLPQPITFEVTQADSLGILFDLQNVGNPLGGYMYPAYGTLSYSVNGGTPVSIDRVASNDNDANYPPRLWTIPISSWLRAQIQRA